MTIQGAITELQGLLKANDVPLYYKSGIRKVIETISMEFVERNRRIEALEHRLELHEKAMAKAIQDEPQTADVCTWDGKVGEIKVHEQTDCPWK